MKNALFSGFAISALLIAAPLSGASAADLPYKAPPPPPPVYNWTGCYVDAGVGYGMYNQDHYQETWPAGVAFTQTTTDGGKGWLGRVGVGCDYQAGKFVLGAFADYDFASISGTNNVPNPIFAPVGVGVYGNEKETAEWAIGGRAGYLITPSLLAYVDAGYTEARFSGIHLYTDTIPPVDTLTYMNANTYHGWFVGGGDEYQLGWFPGLFWRSEYRYAQYNSTDLPCQTFGGLCPIIGDFSWAEHTKKEVQTATTSLVWRFNWGGPVAARY